MSEEQFSQHCADTLEEMILAEGPDTVAAFIGEPVLGTGGIVPPPAGYWQKIQAVLKKYDILLVADEVVTGFGRLGSMFGSDHYGIEADLITIAKGLTSAYLPLSGTIVSDKVWNVLVQGSDAKGVLGHGWTYSAHPLCAAAGIANLELIDRLDLIANARDTGAYLRQALSAAVSGHRLVGDVRGEGMLAAVAALWQPAATPPPCSSRRSPASTCERGRASRRSPRSATGIHMRQSHRAGCGDGRRATA
mgnify:CR=1 FL=1